MVPTPRTRRLLSSSALVLVLAIGTVAGAVARDATTVDDRPTAPLAVVAAPTGAVLGTESRADATKPVDRAAAAAGGAVRLPDEADRAAVGTPVGTPVDRAVRRQTPHKAIEAPADGSGPPSDHHGRNHVWMPVLGIDKSVAGYACSNNSYPGNTVYRWGCAGSNNVYLFGHAHSVFKPLHDAYVRGSLKKGQMLFYADGGGTVHRYKVAWWKVTTPTRGTWAYAAQSRPSLTLQTCLGSRSQYRLIVRLSRVD